MFDYTFHEWLGIACGAAALATITLGFVVAIFEPVPPRSDDPDQIEDEGRS